MLKVLSCLLWLLLKCSKLTSWTLLHTRENFAHNFLFHYEELEAFESFGLALNFCSYILALSIHTQNFNTTLSSFEFQQNPKTRTLGEVQKCVDSNTFPSSTQFYFIFLSCWPWLLNYALCFAFCQNMGFQLNFLKLYGYF